jgi:DNA polymerase III epsilon subunit-like protein
MNYVHFTLPPSLPSMFTALQTYTPKIKHCVVFDLETSFIRKGCHRTDSLILEIGAVCSTTGKTFQTLVNPFLSCTGTLHDALVHSRTQKVSTTLEFWHGLVCSGGTAQKTDRALAEEIETTLLQEQAPSTQEALRNFESFVRENAREVNTCALVAHNGRSFDFKVMRGNAAADSFWADNELVYIDSYHDIARRLYPERKKYGLMPLFQDLVGGKFKHHRALNDAVATNKVLAQCSEDYGKRNDLRPSLTFMLQKLAVEGKLLYTRREKQNPLLYWMNEAVHYAVHKAQGALPELNATNKTERLKVPGITSDLQSLPDVGPVTAAKLEKRGIHSVEELVELRRKCSGSPEFLQKLIGLHRYRSLAEHVETLTNSVSCV